MSAWDPFSVAARGAVARAQEEAQLLNSAFVDTEHLLLGILRETPNEAADALVAQGITYERTRGAAAAAPGKSITVLEMTFTQDAKRAVELAFAAAQEFENTFLACGHLALGITRNPASNGARILAQLGLDVGTFTEAVRRAVTSQTVPLHAFDLRSVRRHYRRGGLLEATLDSDPVAQLRRWLEEAAAVVAESNAMCVSTVGADGAPASRMVLLRGLDDRGLTFYTSYFSRKGRELEANSRIAALFYWAELERQIRIEGIAERVSDEESDAYFASRPRGHQLSAWASEQSETLESRDVLEQRKSDYATRFEDEDVPRPHSWGGFRIVPRRLEFWQGREDRMHDRLEYTRGATGWTIRRLQP